MGFEALIDLLRCLPVDSSCRVPKGSLPGWQSLARSYERGGGRKKCGGENEDWEGAEVMSAGTDMKMIDKAAANAKNSESSPGNSATAAGSDSAACLGASAVCSLMELSSTRE